MFFEEIFGIYFQIREVRAEYESNNYREHFLASQKLVQELQAELDEFAKIADDIEKAQNIQVIYIPNVC